MWLVQYNDYACTAIARIVQYFGETVGSIALLRMQHARFSRYGPILPHQMERPRSQAGINLIPFSDTPHHVFHPHEGNTLDTLIDSRPMAGPVAPPVNSVPLISQQHTAPPVCVHNLPPTSQYLLTLKTQLRIVTAAGDHTLRMQYAEGDSGTADDLAAWGEKQIKWVNPDEELKAATDVDNLRSRIAEKNQEVEVLKRKLQEGLDGESQRLLYRIVQH